MNDLNEVMQKRLDDWRKRTTEPEVKKNEKQNNYVARKDYGDEEDEWKAPQQ